MKTVKRVWKFLKNLVFWIFFIGLFFVTVITVILHVYEDDIKAYAIDELNRHLNTKVEVRNIEVSIFDDFPNASLRFENTLIRDAFEENQTQDTLLYADQLFFHFNLLDVWSGDYKVKRASVHHGQLNLKTMKNGTVNYDIIKPDTAQTSTATNFQFLLELLKVEDFSFRLNNQSTRQNYAFHIGNALIHGDFANTQYSLQTEGDVHVNQLKSGSLTLLADRDAKLNVMMDMDTEAKSYRFTKGDLAISEMQFFVTGAIDSNYLNLDVSGREISVQELLNTVLPADNSKRKDYEGTGLVNFNGKIEGAVLPTQMPNIIADFSVQNGTVVKMDSRLALRSINLTGQYQNQQPGRKEQLSFKNYECKLLNSFIRGSGKIEDFDQPKFITTTNGQLDLASFHEFFEFKNVEELTGKVVFDLEGVIQFFDPEYRKDLFEIISSNGNVRLENITFKALSNHLRLTNVNGDLLVKGKDAATKNLSVKTAKSDVLLNGAFKNLIPYIEGSGQLGLIASMESRNIDLNEILGPSNRESSGSPTAFSLPADLNLNIEMHVDNFEWDKHTFKQVTGQMLMANKKVSVKHFNMNTLGGNVKGDLALNNQPNNENIIDGKVRFSHINISQLFAEWDNFKQTSITDKNLSGKVSGDIDLLLIFDQYFNLMEDKIYALSNLNIIQGELNDLETMKSITDYMRSNKALKLMLNKHIDRFEEKLMHLKFSEIDNQIEIKNRKIIIPKMIVKTNALDVELFGWHDFDNNIDYHFSFRFRQLKTKPEYTEFGKVEDDGLGLVIYLSMSGSIDNPEFSLDSDERKNDIKETIEKEKSTVKSMLKTEFGLFSKDSSVKQMEKESEKEVEFIFYESDMEEKEQTDSTKTEKKKNKKRAGSFFDKLKEQAEKEKEAEQIETELGE